MCHPSGCYAKLLRILQLSKFTFFNAKIWLQLLRVPYNTPMHGTPLHGSTPAVGQPLRSLRVCLRIRARAGRLTVCGENSSTESLSLRASATPAVCANPGVGTPSSLRSFGRLTSVAHGFVITAHRHCCSPCLDFICAEEK